MKNKLIYNLTTRPLQFSEIPKNGFSEKENQLVQEQVFLTPLYIHGKSLQKVSENLFVQLPLSIFQLNF